MNSLCWYQGAGCLLDNLAVIIVIHTKIAKNSLLNGGSRSWLIITITIGVLSGTLGYLFGTSCYLFAVPDYLFGTRGY